MKFKLLASALLCACLFTSTSLSAQTAPTASFSMSSPTLCAESTLQITDLSTDFPTSWSYSVNGVAYSTAQNPDVTINLAGTYTIDLEATNSNGTSPVFSQTLLVEPIPVITVSGNTLVCTLASNTFVANGADTYSWSSGSSGSTEVVYPAANSIYTLVGISTLTGCFDSVFVSVTTVPLPTITVSNATICAGSPYTLTPSGASTYSYSGGTNIISPFVNTSYTVSGTDALTGCSDSVVVAITVSNVSLTVNNGTVCAGQAYTIVATGAASYTYSGGSNVVTPTVSTTYTVTGGLPGGCTDFTTVMVSVTPGPTITVNSGSICAGETFTMLAGGASNFTYSGGSNTVAPLTNTSYVISGLNPNTGCVGSTTLTLTVGSLPTITVNSGTICSGQVFTLNPSGAATYTFSNGSSTVMPTASTNYSITGTSSLGCESMAATIATVIVAGTIPNVTITSSNPGVMCAGSSIVLTAFGATSYSWISGQTTQTIVISPTVTSIFNVIGTDANGCGAGASLLQYVSECTGIEKNSSNIEFHLYPNPTTGNLFVEASSQMDLRIVNSLGQLILTRELNTGTNTIDLQDQNSGIYFVTLKQGAEVKTLRIIKH